MADEKTFTEAEHVAILADRVARETAEVTAKADQLEGNVTELQSKLDIAESARIAAEQERDTVKSEFDTFKTGIEQEREAASKKDERVGKLKEVAKHLDDKWFEAEGRVDRIVAMKDEDFEGYLADLASTGAVSKTVTTAVPRETAMAGAPAGDTPTESSARGFLLRGYVVPQEG